MKKLILIFLIVLCGSVANSQHLQFMGIPIDDRAAQFVEKLEKKGFSMTRTSSFGDNTIANYNVENGIFAGAKVTSISLELTPMSHEVCAVTVNCKFKTREECEKFSRFVVNTAKEKYRVTRIASEGSDTIILCNTGDMIHIKHGYSGLRYCYITEVSYADGINCDKADKERDMIRYKPENDI